MIHSCHIRAIKRKPYVALGFVASRLIYLSQHLFEVPDAGTQRFQVLQILSKTIEIPLKINYFSLVF